MKKIIYQIFVLITIMSVNIVATDIEVAADSNAISTAYASATAGDVIILTTSGGIYHEDNYLKIEKKITIRAADGLAEKPILKANKWAAFYVKDGLTLQGIVIDGLNDVQQYQLYIKNATSARINIVLDNCDFINAQRAIGFSGSHAHPLDTLSITNCRFAHMSKDIFLMKSDMDLSPGVVDYMLVENCTFWDGAGTAIYVMPGDTSTAQPSIVINHVTIDNMVGQGISSGINGVTVTNSIVTNNDSTVAIAVSGSNSSVQYTLTMNDSLGVEVSNGAYEFLNTSGDPLFVDAANGDFALSAGSPAINAGSDGKNLGDLNWLPPLLDLIEVAEGTDGIKAAYEQLAPGGTIVLTTSGGTYHETEKIGLKYEEAKRFSVVAADGLDEKPIVTTDGESVFRIDQGLLLRGIIFNLRNSLGGGSKYLMYSNNSDTTSNLIIDGCEIVDASRGVYGGSKQSIDTIKITNTKITKCENQAIHIRSKVRPAKTIIIENCTFDSTDIAINVITRSGATDDPNTFINHVTIHATGSPSINVSPVDTASAITEVKNVIVMGSDSLACSITGPNASVHHLLYYECEGGISATNGASSSDIQIGINPLFVDAANGDFNLQGTSPAIGAADDSENLGDLNWSVGVGVGEELSLPTIFALSQNYPNPFNPSTTIKVSIPESGFYSLKVYNILGQVVATLINKELNPGYITVNFDAKNFSSGLYIYSLTGNNVNLTKKMMLLK